MTPPKDRTDPPGKPDNPGAQGQERRARMLNRHGQPVDFPTGRWLAEVGPDGELVVRDGLLVRVD